MAGLLRMSSGTPHPPVLVYLSYADVDREALAALKRHLSPLCHAGLIESWDRGQITPGDNGPATRSRQLEQAQVVVALLSADYMDDDVGRQELKTSLAASASKKLHLVLVKYRAVLLLPPLADLQLLPRDGRPIIPHHDQDEAWREVASEIQRLVKALPSSPPAPGASPEATGSIPKLLAGISELPGGQAQNIQRFLEYYLGTPERPALFCGREQDLAALDDWRSDTQTPANHLLIAPGGRGKSALLAHWAYRLAQEETVLVAFVPVSLRFETQLPGSFFSALAARLAWLHDEPIDRERLLDERQARALVNSGLTRAPTKGRQLIVLLDGLDEAGWEVGATLLPSEPPVGVKVMVAVREGSGDRNAAGWCERLGWKQNRSRVQPLTTLGDAGVSEGLRKALGSAISSGIHRAALVSELTRLSAGEPLLIDLYLGDLAAGRVSPDPAALRGLRPGLAEYFDRWLREQRKLWGEPSPHRERSVETVLHLLAGAQGPLLQDDLIALARDILPGTSALRDAVAPLVRFLVGDGRGNGFVFTHSGLGSHFWDNLSQAEQAAVDDRFLALGKKTVERLEEGQMTPEQALHDRYIVQHYRAHLERAGAGVTERMALVSNGWRRGWWAVEGGYGGFMADVGAVRAWVRHEDERRGQRGETPRHIVDGVRCALARASVGSLAHKINPDLMKLLLEEQLWTARQALSYLEHRTDSSPDARYLEAIFDGDHLPDDLLPEGLNAAVAFAQRLGANSKPLLQLLPRLARHLPEQTIAALSGLPRRDLKVEAFIELLKHVDETWREELWAAALEVARKAEHPGLKARLLRQLAEVRATVVEEALAATRALQGEENVYARWQGLRELISLVEEDLRPTVGAEVLAAACATHRPVYQVLGLLELPELPASLREQIPYQAWELAQEAAPHERVMAMMRVVRHLAEPERRQALEDVLHEIYGLPEEELRVQKLIDWGQVEPALAPRIMEEAQRLTRPQDRELVLICLAPHLPPDTWPEAWEKAAARGDSLLPHQEAILEGFPIAEAVDRIRGLPSPVARVKLFTRQISRLEDDEARLALANEVWQLAWQEIRHPEQRIQALLDLFQIYPHPRLLTGLLKAARAEPQTGLALLRWARWHRLRPQYQEETFEVILDLVRTQPADHRGSVLLDVARRLESTERERVLLEALALGRALHLDELTELAGLASGALRRRALLTALTALQRIEDSFHQLEIIGALAPSLPETFVRQTFERLMARDERPDRARGWLYFHNTLPPPWRQEFWSKALIEVRKLAEPRDRAGLLVALLRYAPQEEQLALVQETLTAVEEALDILAAHPQPHGQDHVAQKEIERWHGEQAVLAGHLGLLAQHVDDAAPWAEQLESVVETLDAPDVRLQAWAAFLVHIPGRQEEWLARIRDEVNTITAATRHWWDWSDRSFHRVLATAEHLAPPERQRVVEWALARAEGDRRTQERLQRLASVLRYLPEPRRSAEARRWHSEAMRLPDHERRHLVPLFLPYLEEVAPRMEHNESRPWQQQHGMSLLGPLDRVLPGSHGADLEHVLDRVEALYEHASPPTQQLAMTARILTRLMDEPSPPWARIATAIDHALQSFSNTRPLLLGALHSLAPVFLRLGHETAREVAETVLEVCDWWREEPEHGQSSRHRE